MNKDKFNISIAIMKNQYKYIYLYICIILLKYLFLFLSYAINLHNSCLIETPCFFMIYNYTPLFPQISSADCSTDGDSLFRDRKKKLNGKVSVDVMRH